MLYKIALVDDQDRIINQLTNELNALNVVDIVFTAKNGEDYLQKMKMLPTDEQPQVVIMDIEMPVMGGIEAVRNSSVLYGKTQYIMFTVADDDDKLFDAIKAGAHGYLLKDELADAIVAAIKEMIDEGGAPMSPAIARKTLKLLSRESGKKEEVAVATTLSEREIEILKGMVAGLNYKQIADKVFLSPFTVRNHISKIYSKLHITSKTEAVKLAINNRWV